MITPKDDLLAQFDNDTMAVDPSRGAWIASCLRNVTTHARYTELSQMAHDGDFWYPRDDWRCEFRPYVVADGILQVPVRGTLLNKFPWALGSWATGYTYIQKAVERGMEDPLVTGIAFICDSPGGEVSGCFELCDKLFEQRGKKPMRAFVSDRAYSAAYAVASCADGIIGTRSSGSGSIGVFTMHVSFEGALEQAGIEVTFVQAGKFKTEGNSQKKLSVHAKQRMQTRVDESNDVFIATVARNRAALDEESIRALQGDSYSATEALSIGLIDKIETFEEALVAFSNDCATPDGDSPMANEAPKPITQADHDAAVAAATEAGKQAGLAEGEKVGVAKGVAQERARITAIVTHDKAKGKVETALALALKSDTNAEAAAAVLETIAAPQKGQGQSPFEKAMAESGNPQVGADDPGDGGGNEQMSDDDKRIAEMRAAHSQQSGRQFGAKKK